MSLFSSVGMQEHCAPDVAPACVWRWTERFPWVLTLGLRSTEAPPAAQHGEEAGGAELGQEEVRRSLFADAITST